MQENILEDSQEEKPKTSLKTKILTGVVLTGSLFLICGFYFALIVLFVMAIIKRIRNIIKFNKQ